MRLVPPFIVLSFIAALSACTARQSRRPDARPVPVPAPAPTTAADPMANFARMVGGEWKMTAQAGTSMYDVWHWGAGKRSLRVMTHGDDAQGNPWLAVQAVYWHPGRKQTCLWGLNPFERSVEIGSITFDGETAEAIYDLHQRGVRRTLARRWSFEGRDTYHAVLLEATGPSGFVPLVAWDYTRSKTLTPVRAIPADKEPEIPERLKALAPLQGQTWEARGNWGTGEALRIRSTVEWVPYADGIYASVVATSDGGAPTHVLDAYLYHHTGTGALRCLALSHHGGVYEGDLTVLDGGALQVDMTGYEDDQVVPLVGRLDFDTDGTLRHRIWSLLGAKRTLMLDVHHKQLEPDRE